MSVDSRHKLPLSWELLQGGKGERLGAKLVIYSFFIWLLQLATQFVYVVHASSKVKVNCKHCLPLMFLFVLLCR